MTKKDQSETKAIESRMVKVKITACYIKCQVKVICKLDRNEVTSAPQFIDSGAYHGGDYPSPDRGRLDDAFSDCRLESRVAKHSHRHPVGPSRTMSLLPSVEGKVHSPWFLLSNPCWNLTIVRYALALLFVREIHTRTLTLNVQNKAEATTDFSLIVFTPEKRKNLADVTPLQCDANPRT